MVIASPRPCRALAIGAMAIALCSSPTFADTLPEAMAAALRHYPPILAEGARKEAARIGIDVARSGYHPRVTASGDIGAASGNRGLAAGGGGSTLGDPGSPFGTDWTSRWGYALQAEQPLYDGFRTRSAVAEAQAGAEGAGAQVRLTEQVVLLETVAVYADLLRDRDVEALRTRDVAALAEHVKSAVARAERGEASVTDVAQARARHAQAIADLITTRASAEVRAAEYVRVIGRAPGKLSRPNPPGAMLPRSRDASVASAIAKHPMAATVVFKEEASRHAVERQRADGLPQVKLRGGIEGDRALSGASPGRDSASIALRVTVPLYDGGESDARVRQAQQVNRGLAEDARGVRDRLQAGAVTAWTGLAAARERIAVERNALAEVRRALEGVREEIRLGQRSIIDGLDAQREVVTGEVRVATGARELLVAHYALLSAAGVLSYDAIVAETAPQPAGATKGWGGTTVEKAEPKRGGCHSEPCAPRRARQ